MTLPNGWPSTSIPALHLESSWQNCAAVAPPKEWPNTPTRVRSSRPVNLPDESEVFNCSNRSSTNAMSVVHAIRSLLIQGACCAFSFSAQSSGLFSGVLLITRPSGKTTTPVRKSEEHTSELQSRLHLVCRLLLEKK